jgi:hypothetical protein
MATTNFPVNPTLSAIAIGYKNRDVDLIADQVMPRAPKGGKKFNYTKYTAADGYTVPDTKVGRRSEPNVVEFGGVGVNDECLDWGLDDIVPNDEIEAWEAMPKPEGATSPLMKSTSLTTGLILLDREVRVAATVFNTANHVNNTTLAGTSQWSDFVNSNPLDAILAGLDVPIFRPNVLTLGQATWTKLRQHPKIVQAVFGTAQTGGSVSRQQLADVLEIKQIIVGAGFVNTAKKGQTANMTRVWGKHAAAMYVSEDAANADMPTWGFTAQFGVRIAGEMAEPKTGLRGSVRVRVGESVKEVVSASDVSYYWQNAVA